MLREGQVLGLLQLPWMSSQSRYQLHFINNVSCNLKAHLEGLGRENACLVVWWSSVHDTDSTLS